jgi:hypothetical protein
VCKRRVTGRLFVVGPGRIFTVNLSGPVATLFADEQYRRCQVERSGLLGMAFHPAMPAMVWCFCLTSDNPVADNGANFAPHFAFQSRERPQVTRMAVDNLIRSQPYDNHNGGHRFPPDQGYLYIGFGDRWHGGDRRQIQNFINVRQDAAH